MKGITVSKFWIKGRERKSRRETQKRRMEKKKKKKKKKKKRKRKKRERKKKEKKKEKRKKKKKKKREKKNTYPVRSPLGLGLHRLQLLRNLSLKSLQITVVRLNLQSLLENLAGLLEEKELLHGQSSSVVTLDPVGGNHHALPGILDRLFEVSKSEVSGGSVGEEGVVIILQGNGLVVALDGIDVVSLGVKLVSSLLVFQSHGDLFLTGTETKKKSLFFRLSGRLLDVLPIEKLRFPPNFFFWERKTSRIPSRIYFS